MKEDIKAASVGSDWTRLLTDLDLVAHLGPLLQTYRQVPAEQREATLLEAMRKIKEEADRTREAKAEAQTHDPAPADTSAKPAPAEMHAEPELAPPEAATDMPPFEPDCAPPPGDRRRHSRTRCYVAVEIHVEGAIAPIWGNLANVSPGGCLVETAGPVPTGKALQIGLWVSSGKLWVKGVILSGVVTQTASFGVHVKFSEAELSEKKHLREFLNFVRKGTRKIHSGQAYVTELKR